MFRPTKERISWNQKANATYVIQCPDCRSNHVGETNTNLMPRLSEHRRKDDQIMFQHFRFYEEFNYRLNHYSSADFFSGNETVNHLEYVFTSVIGNCKIEDFCSKWTILQYLEANCIKKKSSKTNFFFESV